MYLFDEGSPKASHKLVVAVAVIASIVMFVGASVVLRSDDRMLVLNSGGGWAMMGPPFVVALLIAWHRGWIGRSWPLAVALLLAVMVFGLVASDWITGQWAGPRIAVELSWMLYLTLASSVTAAVACALGLWLPIVERSEALGARSRKRASGED